MKNLVLVLLMFPLTSLAQTWTFEQGVRTGKTYCRPGAQKIAQKHEKNFREMGQIAYANGLHFAIEKCSNSGKFEKPKKRVNPICTNFNKENFSRLYKFVGCNKPKRTERSTVSQY